MLAQAPRLHMSPPPGALPSSLGLLQEIEPHQPRNIDSLGLDWRVNVSESGGFN